MNKNLTLGLCVALVVLMSCAPSPASIAQAVVQTQAVWTPLPSQTAYPTLTAFPTYTQAATATLQPTYTSVPTMVVVQTQVVTQIATVIVPDTSSQCTSVPSKAIDYTSQATVSASLKAWLEESQSSIDTAKWETVYSNSKTAIHRLTGKYLWVFIAYFKDDKNSILVNRTFNVSAGCWLD